MPVLLAPGKPDDVARADFFDGSAPALNATAAGSDDESLAQRMGVPGSASARLEGHGGAGYTGGVGALEWGINADRAGKPIGGAFG